MNDAERDATVVYILYRSVITILGVKACLFNSLLGC